MIKILDNYRWIFFKFIINNPDIDRYLMCKLLCWVSAKLMFVHNEKMWFSQKLWLRINAIVFMKGLNKLLLSIIFVSVDSEMKEPPSFISEEKAYFCSTFLMISLKIYLKFKKIYFWVRGYMIFQILPFIIVRRRKKIK